jgi:hypothetical protein
VCCLICIHTVCICVLKLKYISHLPAICVWTMDIRIVHRSSYLYSHIHCLQKPLPSFHTASKFSSFVFCNIGANSCWPSLCHKRCAVSRGCCRGFCRGLGTITSAHLSAQRSASTHARKDPTRRPETLQ